jgi:hypothetical protein
LELVRVNKDLEVEPSIELQPQGTEPTKEWFEQKAAYLELTKRQGGSFYKFEFPYLVCKPSGRVEFEQREGKTYLTQLMRWSVTYQRYEGNENRSYKDWPRFAHVQLPYGHRGNIKDITKFEVVNESGSAIYYKVWNSDPHRGSPTYAGRYVNPVYALWKSTGTVKPKSKRTKLNA